MIAAGCGSGGGPADVGAEASTTPTATVSAQSLATFASYTRGPRGPATKPPMTIGLVNTESGPFAVPGYAVAAEAAVRLVNEQLGGANGHRIQLRACGGAGGAGDIQSCAQGLAQDPSMVTILQGSVDPQVTTLHPAAGATPVVGTAPMSNADAQATNSYYLSAGQFGVQSMVAYARQFATPQSVALVAPSGPGGGEQTTATMEQSFKAAGITVYRGAFAPTATDHTPVLQAVRAADVDLLINVATAADHCVGLARALQKTLVNAPIVGLNNCHVPRVREALGDYPKWTFLSGTVNAQAAAVDDLTAWQTRAVQEWVGPLRGTATTVDNAVHMLQLVLTVAKVANEVGAAQLTAASFGERMKRFAGPVFLGVPTLRFGAAPLPAVGSTQTRFYHYLGNDDWRDATNGAWVSPPPPSARTTQTRGG